MKPGIKPVLSYDPDKSYHVWPNAEEGMHVLYGLDCPCGVKISKNDDEGLTITHKRTYTVEPKGHNHEAR